MKLAIERAQSFSSQSANDDLSIAGQAPSEMATPAVLTPLEMQAARTAPATVCDRELMHTERAAERVEKSHQSVAKLLWDVVEEMPPDYPYGKSEASISKEIAQAQALRDVSHAGLHNSMRALAAVTAAKPSDAMLEENAAWLDEAVDVLPDLVHDAMASAGIMRSPALAPGADGDHTPGSYGDFWDKLSGAIGGLKTDYLGVYEKAVEKNNAFYRDFTKFVSDSVKWTVGEKDVTLTLDDVEAQVTDADVDAKFNEQFPNGIGIPTGLNLVGGQLDKFKADLKAEIRKTLEAERPSKRTGFLVALRELMHKYTPWSEKDALVSVHVDPADGADAEAIAEAKAKKWASDMGLPETSVKQNPLPPGEWWVMVDLTPVKNMIDQLEALSSDKTAKKVTLTPARYSTYQSGSETQKEQLKTTASTLGQKMAGAQSIYENLIKVLTSTISAMLDSARSFLMN